MTTIQELSVILRVMVSKERTINVEANVQLCLACYQTFLTAIPWASNTPSPHHVLGHSTERIEVYDNFCLGDISKEGLESHHKLVLQAAQCLQK